MLSSSDKTLTLEICKAVKISTETKHYMPFKVLNQSSNQLYRLVHLALLLLT